MPWGMCRRGRPPLASKVLVALLLVSGSSTAQAPSEEGAMARELFDQGRALMDSKDYERACAKFAESQRLDPGGGTLLNLALCHELSGKTATAWAEFDQALRMARADARADRVEFAEVHLNALAPRLSRLRVVVAPEARVPGLAIERNGDAMAQATWDVAIPVDPGEQVIEARAPGKRAMRVTVLLGPDADTQSVVIPVLANAALREPRAVVSAAPVPPPQRRVAQPPAGDDDGGAFRIAGAVVGGVGLVALAVGTYFGIRALNMRDEAESKCPSYERCHPDGILASEDATVSAHASTALIAGGAAFTGTGLFLFFYPSVVATASSTVGAGLRGRF